MKIILSEKDGVQVESDFCLYGPEELPWCDERYFFVALLSIHGPTQAVRSIWASLAGYHSVKVYPDSIHLSRDSYTMLRKREWVHGAGTSHILIWDSTMIEKLAIWWKPEERLPALERIIKRRKVPYDRKYLPALERYLLEQENLVQLKGWGGAKAYCLKDCSDDCLCNAMLEVIRKDLNLPVPMASCG